MSAIKLNNLEHNCWHGVYDMTNEEYHSSVGISRSAIMEFNKTPYHFYTKYVNPTESIKKESKSVRIGGLLHPFILEHKDFNNRYIIVEKRDKRTREGKAYYDQIELNKGSKEFINDEEFQSLQLMSNALHSDKKIHELLTGAKYEKSIYWTDPDTGLLCKCRPDIWHNSFIVDLKTTCSANYRDFQRSIVSYGYHIQFAMMNEAFKHVFNIDMTDFVFVIIENKEPYATAIYPFDKFSLEQSVEIFKNKLFEIKECYDNNLWPSYKTQVMCLPNYAIGE